MAVLKEVITLINGDKCEIREINTFDLVKAMFKHEENNRIALESNRITAIPFLVNESITINGSQVGIVYVLSLDIVDYTAICEVFSALCKDVNNLKF